MTRTSHQVRRGIPKGTDKRSVVLFQIYVDFTYILKYKKFWCVKITLEKTFKKIQFFLKGYEVLFWSIVS